MSALAADSILVQQRLDAEVAASRERFAALLATLPAAARPLLLPLAPPAIVVKEYRIRCDLRITTDRAVGFSLVAAPVNLGYCALYETTASEQCSFTIEVVPLPIPLSIATQR